MAYVVDLAWHELRTSAYLGIDRWTDNRAKGRRVGYGADPKDVQRDIVGCWTEHAVAKAKGCYWFGNDPVPDQGAADVAGLHVRGVTQAGYGLIVHESDADDGVFLLVTPLHLTGSGRRFRLDGWVKGGDAKQRKFWRGDIRCPTFIVPPEHLRPLDELA